MSAGPSPLAVTLGDPAGVGPEIIVKAWAALRAGSPPFVVVGDYDVVSAQARGGVVAKRVSTPDEAAAVFPDALPVLDHPLLTPVVAGQPSAAHASSIIRWIETAAGLALSRAVCGIVTCPIAKAPLYRAGFAFPGHTEYLGELASDGGGAKPVMMLASPELRVSLVTIHRPLAEVPAAVTRQTVLDTIRVTAEALERDLGIAAPRLAVAGLNPHAGEHGEIGREEAESINPACAKARTLGIDCTDALPADSLFHEEARRRYDAVVCMYHDQGLIPLKALSFWNGVNVTLGLPIVRTSPDHGVGYAIAGRGQARADSLIAAIKLAGEIAGRRPSA